MPVYEYFCADCHTRFDTLRAMSRADEAILCEHCGGMHTARVLSVFSVKSGDGASVMSESSEAGCRCGGACACGAH